MRVTKVTKRGKNTQIRATEKSAAMLRKLSKDLYSQYEDEHTRHGLKTPSSRLAIDWLIYEACKAGIGAWPELTEKNNLFMMITTDDKEE